MAMTGDIKFSNITYWSYRVEITNAKWDGAELKNVQVALFPKAKGGKSARWISLTRTSQGTWSGKIDLGSFVGTTGVFGSHIYYYNKNGKRAGYSGAEVTIPRYEDMQMTGDVKIKNVTWQGFDIELSNAYWGDEEVSQVKIPTWPNKYYNNGAKSLPPIWYEAKRKGPGLWTVHVDTFDYKGTTGSYTVHVYYYNNSSRRAFPYGDVIVPDRSESVKQGNKGFRIIYWKNATTATPIVVHEPLNEWGDKVLSGVLKKEVNTADEFTFRLPTKNSNYQKLDPVTGLIEVIDLRDKKTSFLGRIMEIKGMMDSSGLFYQEVVCESVLAYLHDMTLAWEKRSNKGPREILEYTLNFYNARVEKHKRFQVGDVTVPNNTDKPYIYYDFESAWEFLKRMIETFGGYIILRSEENGNFIDWLDDPGEHKTTPIKIGENIKSAERYISLSDMLTQIVPIGGDDESYKSDDSGTTSDNIRPRIHIGSVNNGGMSLQDNELVRQFGIIRKVVEWSEITNARTLRNRGQQYLNEQKVAMANWKISVVDRSYIDDRYEKFQLYNYHPIVNAPLSGIEELQIIALTIDITKPQSVDLEIGSSSLNFTSWQLQNRNAQKSIEKLQNDLNAQKAKTEEENAALLVQIDNLNKQIKSYEEQLNQATGDSTAILDKIAALNIQIDNLFSKVNETTGGNDGQV